MGAWKGRKALILAAAPCDNLDYVRDFMAQTPDCVIICADGGAKYAKRLGLIPDVLVADFDSGSSCIPCGELIRLTPEKDDTDLQHCVYLAIQRGCTDITLACATGGRLDHLLANLLLCESAFEAGARLTVIDRQNTVFLHTGGCMQLSRAQARRYVSLIPLDRKLVGVTLSGLKYPLQDAVITRTRIVSISNEVVEDAFQIRIDEGRAFVVFSEDAPGTDGL